MERAENEVAPSVRLESHFQPSHDLEFHRRGPHQGCAAEWIEATGQKSIQSWDALELVDPIFELVLDWIFGRDDLGVRAIDSKQ